MKAIFTVSLSLIAIVAFSISSFAQEFSSGGGQAVEPYGQVLVPEIGGSTFFDDFDAYTAGLQLVGQSGGAWDTWSGGGGTSEDPFVSNAYAYSGSNSTMIAPGNDLVRYHGQLTSGKWYISVLIYIPTGGGYFNTMAGFTPNPFNWGMDAYFNVGGTGDLLAGSPTPIPFTWSENTWQQAMVVVDLDLDLAEFWFGTSPPLTMIHSWQWTLGNIGGGSPLQLDASDFYGATGVVGMYIDDYYFGDTPPVILPVELTSFAASVNNEGDVILNWTTATELNNQMFEVERRSNVGQFTTIGFVNGYGTTSEPQEYSYIDNTVVTGTYFYRLKQIDFLGSYEYSDAVEVEVNGPLTFALEQNYPNPFNPSTTINYSVPESGFIKLSIYNIVGEEISVLVNRQIEAGFYEVSFNASNLPSGTYFYSLQTGSTVQTKKMVLMR